MFSALIIVYLFLGGCGAGVLLVTSVSSLVFFAADARNSDESMAFRRFRVYALGVGTCIVGLSALCLAFDLGRPDRILALFARPFATYLNFGTYVLCAAMLLGGFLFCAEHFWQQRVSVRVKVACEFCCAIAALALMGYTGAFLAQIVSVPFWNSPCVIALFVLSALSTGMAVVFLVLPFADQHRLLERFAARAHGFHLAFIVAEALVLAVYLLWAMSDSYVARSALLLVRGWLAPWFFGGTVVCGLAVPLIAELKARLTRTIGTPAMVEVLLLFGGFALRFCMVQAGLH